MNRTGLIWRVASFAVAAGFIRPWRPEDDDDDLL